MTALTTPLSLTGEDPGWSNTDWAAKWGEALGVCIKEEIQKEGAPPITEWRVTGRKSKEWPHKEDMGWWSINGVGLSKAYADWRLANPEYRLWVTPDGTAANELDFTVPFGNVLVRVIVDRVFVVNQALVIVDLKSGTSMPEDVLQLCLYAAAIDLKYKIRPEIGAYFSARKGAIVDTEVLSNFPTQMMVDLMEDFARQREQAVYLPNPGRQCTWCEAGTSCPWGSSLASAIKGRSRS